MIIHVKPFLNRNANITTGLISPRELRHNNPFDFALTIFRLIIMPIADF